MVLKKKTAKTKVKKAGSKLVKPATKATFRSTKVASGKVEHPVPAKRDRIKVGRKVKSGKSAKAAASSNGLRRTQECLCGCGEKTVKFFIRGHIARFNGWIKKIANGEAKPEKLLPKKVVNAMGPWKPTKSGGLKPTVSDYRKLRPETKPAT